MRGAVFVLKAKLLSMAAYKLNMLISVASALVDVTLSLDEGSILLILGPNGSGKTTLISTLAGLIKTDRGEIRISGSGWAPPT